MTEVWKDINGYEDLYQVSNYGNVKSKNKIPKYKGQSYLKSRVLKQDIVKRNHTNYRRVTLCKNGKCKGYQVHRLVAGHFIPNPENKCCVNHIDNNGENNKVTNLEWVTQKENMQHSIKQGRSECMKVNLDNTHKIIASNKRMDAKVGSIIGQYEILSVDSYGKKGYFICKCNLCNTIIKKRKDALNSGHKKCRMKI